MRAAARLGCAVLWLISNRQIYLNGFWKRGIQPKRGKDSQKGGGGKCGAVPFTMPALTMAPRLRGLTVYLGSGAAVLGLSRSHESQGSFEIQMRSSPKWHRETRPCLRRIAGRSKGSSVSSMIAAVAEGWCVRHFVRTPICYVNRVLHAKSSDPAEGRTKLAISIGGKGPWGNGYLNPARCTGHFWISPSKCSIFERVPPSRIHSFVTGIRWALLATVWRRVVIFLLQSGLPNSTGGSRTLNRCSIGRIAGVDGNKPPGFCMLADWRQRCRSISIGLIQLR